MLKSPPLQLIAFLLTVEFSLRRESPSLPLLLRVPLACMRTDAMSEGRGTQLYASLDLAFVSGSWFKRKVSWHYTAPSLMPIWAVDDNNYVRIRVSRGTFNPTMFEILTEELESATSLDLS